MVVIFTLLTSRISCKLLLSRLFIHLALCIFLNSSLNTLKIMLNLCFQRLMHTGNTFCLYILLINVVNSINNFVPYNIIILQVLN